jgi:hypothetical protein
MVATCFAHCCTTKILHNVDVYSVSMEDGHVMQEEWHIYAKFNLQGFISNVLCNCLEIQSFIKSSLITFGVPTHGRRTIGKSCSFVTHQGRETSRWLKNSTFATKFFASFHFLASFCRAHAGTLQNHSISPHANTVLNTTVESCTIFHRNLMLCNNLVYEI